MLIATFTRHHHWQRKNFVFVLYLALASIFLAGADNALANIARDNALDNQLDNGTGVWARVASSIGGTSDFVVDSSNKLIEQEKAWLKRNSNYLRRVTRRSEPYAYHIVQRCLSRGLPIELALVPVVESSFDVYAYSPGQAAGLWQFTPSTGRYFDLHKNWWYDARRDPVASTEKALDYLEKLHGRFDDWLLALAAYNAGPARVSRAIRANEKKGLPTDYWSLKLPEETRRYVPRILAVRSAVLSPAAYGAELYHVENAPYFESVQIGSQLDLAQASKLSDVDIETLYRLNPGLSRWATPPEGPHYLNVPFHKREVFEQRLAYTPAADRLKWARYQVKSGDSLSQIAIRYGTDTTTIQSANEMNTTRIRIGQALIIPMATESSAHYVMSDEQRAKARMRGRSNKTKYVHTVTQGDSWWSIAKNHKVSSAQLARWNGKSARDVIRPGQKLVVWKPLSKKEMTTVHRNFVYKVRNGDNLSRIASRYKVSVDQLVNWNNISTDKYLKPGQPLKIKVAVAGGV